MVTDIVGTDRVEMWYVECKRYTSSISWPTVWTKLSYADSQGADVFLLASNSNPSPNCETEIANWNSQRRRPAIRVWRGYVLERLLVTKPHIVLSHGLDGDTEVKLPAISALSELILGVVQSASSRHHFGLDVAAALETGSVLSELLEQRLADVSKNGRFGSGHRLRAPPNYEWLCASGEYVAIEEIAFIATIVALYYFSGAASIRTRGTGRSYSYVLTAPALALPQFRSALNTVLEWSCAELYSEHDESSEGVITFRH